ncbi:MAG: Lipopolysaccharide core heptosyltransferase RfaQ [Syntrophorhabdaceae bacterium PtaU1.Bin034]|nr:MAG: Lipopolysaccharide core heptosyltransferase RfaQ [Syntrophorhabdaceae bacterium PtaU1.Bin034]
MTAMTWDRAKNILAVRLDSIGDVLMTTPAIRALRESGPDRRIFLLTSPSGAEAAALVPEIDEIVVYEAPWMKATPQRDDSGAEYDMIDRLRRCGLDGAVIFTVYSQNPFPAALLCYLADIPLRLAHCRENPYQVLTDWVAEKEPQEMLRHEVRRQLDLVASIGCTTRNERLSLAVPKKAVRSIGRVLKEMGVGEGRPFVVIHPGATAPSRRYPPEKFAELGRRVVRELGLQVVFTGTESEVALVEKIQSSMGVASFSLAGVLDLAELAALLSSSALLISNNTGPAHVAAAVGAPVVSLYALTNPQHVPWRVPGRVLFHDMPCKYCYKSICPRGHNDCLRLVPPSDVFSAVSALYDETGAVKAAREVS